MRLFTDEIYQAILCKYGGCWKIYSTSRIIQAVWILIVVHSQKLCIPCIKWCRFKNFRSSKYLVDKFFEGINFHPNRIISKKYNFNLQYRHKKHLLKLKSIQLKCIFTRYSNSCVKYNVFFEQLGLYSI